MTRPATLRCVVIAALAVLLAGTTAPAQNYPTRPVRIVVPFPPGGPLDFTARLVADRLATSLKQPFVVENRPGASGQIGTDAVAKAEPDGYTLLFVLDTPLTVSPALHAKLPFDPERDFEPISVTASFSMTLVVHPSVPANSLPEFVTYARNLQRPLLYGSGGGGGGDPGHLTMEYFRIKAGFEGVHVPYKGNAEVVMGLVGGQVQAGFLATPGVLPLAREGRLKALAISSPQSPIYASEIGTIAENGYAGFEVGFYQVMLTPRAVPESIRALLEREVRQTLQAPEVQTRLRAQALEPIGSTGSEAKVLLRSASERWRSVIKTSNIRIE
jgi:tripartite-type tricarboxylate transporter receptor subunit TctC